MLATNPEDRASTKIGIKLGGILSVTLSLAVGLACSSPASPIVDVPPPEPALVLPSVRPAQVQESPTLTPNFLVASDGLGVIDASQPLPPTVGPKLSNPGNLAYDALMAAALDSLPHFNRLGDDSGVSRFGRVPVNLDQVAGQMVDSGDIAYAPVLIDFLRMQLYFEGRTTLSSYLEQLVGSEEQPDIDEQGEWKLWSEWLRSHPEIEPPQGYAAWKGRFLAHIDPEMGAFFYEGVKTRIRLEAAGWEGVPKDGIPDLINPPAVIPQDAWYMDPTDRVLGISINGEHRAYPLRILPPYEMANDVLGGEPIALAY